MKEGDTSGASAGSSVSAWVAFFKALGAAIGACLVIAASFFAILSYIYGPLEQRVAAVETSVLASGSQANDRLLSVEEGIRALTRAVAAVDKSAALIAKSASDVKSDQDKLLVEQEKQAKANANFETLLKGIDERNAEIEGRLASIEKHLDVPKDTNFFFEPQPLPFPGLHEDVNLDGWTISNVLDPNSGEGRLSYMPRLERMRGLERIRGAIAYQSTIRYQGKLGSPAPYCAFVMLQPQEDGRGSTVLTDCVVARARDADANHDWGVMSGPRAYYPAFPHSPNLAELAMRLLLNDQDRSARTELQEAWVNSFVSIKRHYSNASTTPSRLINQLFASIGDRDLVWLFSALHQAQLAGVELTAYLDDYGPPPYYFAGPRDEAVPDIGLLVLGVDR